MDAGPELDAEISRTVFDQPAQVYVTGEPVWRWPSGITKTLPPPYSTDIAAAWCVVEHFERAEVLRAASPSTGARYMCALNNPGGVFAWADTAPHAICLAALAAVADKVDA